MTATGPATKTIELGDIVELPGGRALSCRSIVTLPRQVGSMAGFWLLGEMELLISTPTRSDQPHNLYMPVERFPAAADNSACAVEGAARYWAPHLPAIGGAMGEIRYRVMVLRGSLDPVVVVYRGPEAIVFVRTSTLWGHEMGLMAMARGVDNEGAVTRHAAELAPQPVGPAPVAVPVDGGLYATFARR